MADEINPASMIVAPHLKPKLESETKKVGESGDPRGGVAAIHSVDTEEDGTETPWRDTPPHNISSVAETQNDHSPPTDPGINPEDADAKPEVIVPPEEELPLSEGETQMITQPQDREVEEPAPPVKIGGPGDPRMISGFASETPIYGTETPYRKTPPTNFGSAAEMAATTTPPTGGAITQAQADDNATPVAAVAPTVAGTTTNGQTLTCTPAPSPWVPAASSYTYQWYRGDIPISGATAATRVLAAADVGYRMSCRVTGLHATYGGSSPAFTAQTAVVA